MSASYDKNGAIVVLPSISGGRLTDSSLRAWLAHSDLKREPGPIDPLAQILRELGFACPEEGLAALRMWGQTGDRPANWIAAADAIYLEPMLDHLVLHDLSQTGVSAADMRALIDHLQSCLAEGMQFGFTRVGTFSYIAAQSPLATASVPASHVHGRKPDDYLPTGEGADRHRSLVSEIEMALHEHEVNRNREAGGHYPVNSLWIWGGGSPPERLSSPQPPLFAEDPLLTGYWLSSNGVTLDWQGSITDCLQRSVKGFVAEVPQFPNDALLLASCLGELRQALRSGRLDSLTLLFRDGLRAYVRRSHSLRVWRRRYSLLDNPAA